MALTSVALSLLLLLGGSGVAIAQSSYPVIWDITPNRGSLLGSTYVTIWGVGFDAANKQGTTAVFFGNQQGRIEWYDSTDTKLAVWTPPGVEGVVDVRIQMMNVNSRAAYVPCNTASGSCTFSYQWARMPRVTYSYGGGAAGDVYRMSGVLMAPASSMYAVRHGGMLCYLDDALVVNPAAITAWDGTGAVRCYLGEGPAGRMNISAIVGDNFNGYGESWFDRRARSIAPDGSAYQFTRVPAITAVSETFSGLGGGAELVITGTGFTLAPADTTVTLAGVPCNVTSSSRTQVTCIVGPAAAAGGNSSIVYAGSRGLRHRIWLGVNSLTIPSTPPDHNIINNFGVQGYLDNTADYYLQEISGLFVPPVTANYSFYARGDDIVYVQLSNSADPAGLVTIASLTSNSWAFYLSASQISAPRLLIANQSYAFRVLHRETTGEDWFDVALRIHTNPDVLRVLGSPAQRESMSLPEVQSFSVNVDVFREQQTFSVTGAAGGMFTLTWAGQGSSSLPMLAWNATAAEVQSALASRIGCSNVVATRAVAAPVGFSWTLQFNCPTYTGFPQVAPASVSLVAARNTSISMSAARTASASTPLSGSVFLSLDAATPGVQINLGASNADIHRALLSLPGMVELEVAGPWGNSQELWSFDVTFWRPNNVSLLVISAAAPDGSTSLSGSNARVSSSMRLDGSSDPFYWPAPADFFRVPQSTPPVLVTTNGILAACSSIVNTTSVAGAALVGARIPDACSFVYNAAATPTITSVSPASITVGALLTVTGSGFLADADGVAQGPGGTSIPAWQLNTVTLGGALCNVTVASRTQLQCVMSHARTGVYTVRVLVGRSRGLATANASTSLQVAYMGSVSSVSPATGSLAGGTLITITGTGFAGDVAVDSVMIGGAPCALQSASFSALVCITPASATATSAPIVVNGVSVAPTFTYATSATPNIVALSPTRLPAATSGIVNITLTGVPAGVNASVVIDRRPCRVTATAQVDASRTMVTCTLLRGAAAALPQTPSAPIVNVPGLGNAASGAFLLDASFRVNSMSSQFGSLDGAVPVVLHGTGFSVQPGATEVFFTHSDGWGYAYSTACNVTSVAADGSHVVAVVPQIPLLKRGGPSGAAATADINGALVVKSNNITAPCSPSTSGCAFVMMLAATPTVLSASVSADGATLTLNGTALASQAALLTITLGTQRCVSPVVLNSSALACAITPDAAGPAAISIAHSQWGAARDASSFTYNFPLAVNMSQTRGSLAGGLTVSFTGTGFASDSPTRNVVLFNNVQAAVQSVTVSSLTVMLPPSGSGSSDAIVPVAVIVMDGAGAVANGRVDQPAAFTYAASVTPIVSSVTPTVVVLGGTLTIVGSGFTADTFVVIGGAPCAIAGTINASTTSFACVVGATPAGLHRVLVTVSGRGLARTSATVQVAGRVMDVSVLTAAASSMGGGADVVITGSGFGDGASPSSLSVAACNTACRVQSYNATTITCRTGALVTPTAVSAFNVWQPARLSGSVAPPAAAAAMDGRVDGAFTSCSVTLDAGLEGGYIITGVRVYARFRYTSVLPGAAFSASTNGSTWTTLHTVGASVQEGWNSYPLFNAPGRPTVDAGTLPVYRYARMTFARTGADCTANEVEILGIPVAARASGSCPVTITVTPPVRNSQLEGVTAATIVSSNASIAYSLSTTPLITSLTPNNGSALGGTIVTLSGTGLPTDTSRITVSINGIPARVLSASGGTSVTVMTGARDAIRPLSIVLRTDAGLALYDASTVFFRYLDKWSALTTWKYQEPPVEGDTVLVPEGQAILVDISPPRLFLVMVEGDMVFDRTDLTFNASYILVNGGRFEVGTESAPFLNKLTITLHGDRYSSIEIPGIGAKMLAVTYRRQAVSAAGAVVRSYNQGTLDIHGRPRRRTWTKLGAAISAGSTMITTAEDVDWTAGDVLFVTCTRDVTLTEVVTVAQVVDARTLVVRTPFQYDHEYKMFSAGQFGHSDVDMRAEVGLMSRNVIIQGDDNSDAQDYGVHTAAFMSATYRVENAEIRRCGQMGQLGRYCTHTHMLGDRADSYIRYNSIHHSYQRSSTVHASNYVTVKGNAVYDVRGHTVFVEDGVEQFNVIEDNLVALTRPCYICTASDNRPANFWTASPTNFWRNNVAAGSSHFGFWFELPGNPLGPSFTTTYCPSSMPLGEFHNNTAHSSGMGIRIYPVWLPYMTACAGGASMPQYLVNSTLFHNALGTFNRQVGDIHHVNAKYVENGAGFGWRNFNGVVYGNDANVRDTLFVCNTVSPANCGSRAITAPQDEYWYGSGITFVNYGASAALAGCHSCDSDANMKQGGFTYRFDRLAWVNSAVRVTWDAPRKEMFTDLDGTLTGSVNGVAMAYWAWNAWPQCPRDTIGTFSGGLVCDGTVQARRMHLDNVLPSQLYWLNLLISSSVGSAQLQFRPRETYGWSWPMVIARDYNVSFVSTGQIDWRQLRLKYSDASYILPSDWVRLTWNWIDYRYRNRVQYSGVEVPSLPEGVTTVPSTAALGTGTLPAGANSWSVLFSSVNATAASASSRYTIDVAAIQCPPAGCLPPQPPVVLSNFSLWSNPSTWPGGVVPADGDTVVINATSWIVLDMPSAVLRRVTIYGRLEFADAPNVTLSAGSVVVFGELWIGSEARPYVNNAQIVLHGTRTSDAVIVNDNLFASNKVMLVLGRAVMIAAPRNVTYTRLAATALPGETRITLTTSVEGIWMPGDRIALSATSYNYTHAEAATIASVTGTSVTLTRPLRFRHFAGPIFGANASSSSNNYAGTQLRAVVALLTRNVVVRGALANAADTYGAHVMVTSFITDAGLPTETRREGSLVAKHVQFRECGKAGSAYAALAFQYGAFQFAPAVPVSNVINVLEGISVTDGFNDGIRATAAKFLSLNNSVVFRTQISALSLDAASAGANITNNVFLLNEPGVDTNAPGQINWIRPQSAVYMTSLPTRFSGNVVSGVFDSAFAYMAPPCGANHEAYSSNEAHGVRIGIFLLPSTSDCIRVHAATVWKAAHLGIFTVDQNANVQVTGAVVTDSHIGVTGLFLRATRSESSMSIIDSLVAGTTAATAGCTEADTCRAATSEDVIGASCGSVFGASTRRVGVLMPQYLNKPKTCGGGAALSVCEPLNMIERLCSLPWETRYGTTNTILAGFYLTGVTLANFNGSECPDALQSVAISHNPSQMDSTVPTTATRVRWVNTPLEARFNFKTTAATPPACADGAGCDGFNNINILDIDGSVTGVAGSSILGPNPAGAPPSCTWRQAWPGLECTATGLRNVVLQGTSTGRVAVGALAVTRQWNPADNTTWRTSLVAGPTKEPCSKMAPTSIYNIIVPPALPVFVTFGSLEPDAFRLHYTSPTIADGVVISMNIQRAFMWDVFVNGVLTQQLVAPNASTYILPSTRDAAGTMLFHPQLKRMWVTLRGGSPTRWVDIVRTPAIALNLHLAVSVEQFWAADLVFNLATLLNIPSWRIKVVDVQPGSAVITALVLDATPSVYVDSSANASALNASVAQFTRLQNLSSVIAAMASSGNLATIGSYPVLAVTVAPPTPVFSSNDTSVSDAGAVTPPIVIVPPQPSPSPSPSNLTAVPLTAAGASSVAGLNAGTLAAIVIGSVVGFAIVAGVVVALLRHRVLTPAAVQPLTMHRKHVAADFDSPSHIRDATVYGAAAGLARPKSVRAAMPAGHVRGAPRNLSPTTPSTTITVA